MASGTIVEQGSGLHYVDKTSINVSVSANGGYATIGTFASMGVPAGAEVVSFFIRGWSSANGTPSLATGGDGTTLYCFLSDAPSSVTINVRVFYTLL